MSDFNLPEHLYVYMEQDGENVYPIASISVKDCADKDEPREVGRYVLSSKGTVTLEATFLKSE